MAVSPRLSWKGYHFSEALYRNKDTLKGIIALVGGVNVAIGFDWKTFAITVGGAFVGFAVKLVVDAVDFYFGEIDL